MPHTTGKIYKDIFKGIVEGFEKANAATRPYNIRKRFTVSDYNFNLTIALKDGEVAPFVHLSVSTPSPNADAEDGIARFSLSTYVGSPEVFMNTNDSYLTTRSMSQVPQAYANHLASLDTKPDTFDDMLVLTSLAFTTILKSI